MKKLAAFIFALIILTGCAGLQFKAPSQPPEPTIEDLQRQAQGAGTTKIRAFTALTGGGTGALDKISVGDLADGDLALVIVSDEGRFYEFHVSATDTDDGDQYIRPDDYSTQGVWYKSDIAIKGVIASGVITGLVNVSADPANITNFNGTYTVSAAGSTGLPLPTAVAGYSACIRQGQGRTDALSATPATGDYIVKDGVRGTIATAITSGGDATDKACFVAVNDTDWYMDYTGTWGE